VKRPALVCTICHQRIDRRTSILDAPGEPHHPSHASCRLRAAKREKDMGDRVIERGTWRFWQEGPPDPRGWVLEHRRYSPDDFLQVELDEMADLAHVAAEAAGLRLVGADDVVVSRAALDDALQRAQLWQLNNGQRGLTPHDEEAAEARAKLIDRLTGRSGAAHDGTAAPDPALLMDMTRGMHALLAALDAAQAQEETL
jgi:hypothetical protein